MCGDPSKKILLKNYLFSLSLGQDPLNCGDSVVMSIFLNSWRDIHLGVVTPVKKRIPKKSFFSTVWARHLIVVTLW